MPRIRDTKHSDSYILRVITYNIQYCGGRENGSIGYFIPSLPSRRKEIMEKISKVLALHEPDVLGLIEVDSGSWRNAGVNQAKYIAKKLDLPHLIEGCKYLTPFDIFPFFKYNTLAIASKNPMDTSQTHQLVAGFKRNIIEANAAFITFILCHLSLGKNARVLQIHHMVQIINSINTPIVLMGDFNAEPDTVEIKNLVSKAGLNLVPLEATYPSWRPKKKLDHFLVSSDIQVKSASVLDIGLSDHLPIVLDIILDK